uniref:HTH_48 domain-containing protein n=1 Tax=Steinernema glaseri TaxID=37863 RepID=A0A1I7YYN7_9BILA
MVSDAKVQHSESIRVFLSGPNGRSGATLSSVLGIAEEKVPGKACVFSSLLFPLISDVWVEGCRKRLHVLNMEALFLYRLWLILNGIRFFTIRGAKDR